MPHLEAQSHGAGTIPRRSLDQPKIMARNYLFILANSKLTP
jgi:hypothetical protein